MTAETTTEHMISVLEGIADFAVGNSEPEDISRVAAEWLDLMPFTEACEWLLTARCFASDAARRMRIAGITPVEASAHTGAGVGGYWDTIGYKVANGDLSIQEAEGLLADGCTMIDGREWLITATPDGSWSVTTPGGLDDHMGWSLWTDHDYAVAAETVAMLVGLPHVELDGVEMTWTEAR